MKQKIYQILLLSLSLIKENEAFNLVVRKKTITTSLSPKHSNSQTSLYSQQYYHEDLNSAVYRKEHEMKQVNEQHTSLSDPVRMAMGYIVEDNNQPLRLAKALRRTYDDPQNPSHPNYKEKTEEEKERAEKLLQYGMQDSVMRRGSFIVDIKRKSLSRPGETFARYDDAGMVAEASKYYFG